MSTTADKTTCIRFSELTTREYLRLGLFRNPNGTPGQAMANLDGSPPGVTIASPQLTEEPWVSFTSRDLFGLALSGGGIRSATFNLGLLQALERKRLLEHIDYLSTVSGGGYVGGFWTAWRQKESPDAPWRPLFPPQPEPTQYTGGARDTRESAQIRHLREFSQFLMPRVGFAHSEMWDGIVTILGGLLPSLVAGISVIVLLHYTWFYWSYALVIMDPIKSAGVLAGFAFMIQILGEYQRSRKGKDGKHAAAKGQTGKLTPRQKFAAVVSLALAFTVALAGAVWTAVFWLVWRAWWMRDSIDAWIQRTDRAWETGAVPTYAVCTDFDGVLFGPAVAAILAAVILLFLRAGVARVTTANLVRWSTDFDRATTRCLAPAVVLAGLALAWEASHWLLRADWTFGATTGSTVTFGVLFVWLRDWLIKPTEENRVSSLLGHLIEKLKPIAPQLLAAGFLLSMLILVGMLVQKYGLGGHPNVTWGAGGALGIIAITVLVFNPARVGMHDFYRSRIARCFLGAARATDSDPGRATSEQRKDDFTLRELENEARYQRPIHLVCCAANNIAGDTLSSLSRGARSAVLSPFGISIGDYSSDAYSDRLRFSSGLTASAAAFNSQMGRLSMDLGPAVAFAMSTFNLRLGLWVPHPCTQVKWYARWFVGRQFFFEMFGRTKCDPDFPGACNITSSTFGNQSQPPMVRPSEATQSTHYTPDPEAGAADAKSSGAKPSVADRMSALGDLRFMDAHYLHLSDGGHFENLALYELVRRHCRYIIVSDCGADPEVAFDDLAIALRTVREDFGVEIDLDVAPLRPDAAAGNRATQHAVVGMIHYDGYEGTDKGTIVYFKPALTGDEPPDIVQYQARNPAFPHESTGDQFYDEAQWESYRRLGEHAGNAVFRFIDNYKTSQLNDVIHFKENVFLDASRHWHPTPPGQSEAFLELTARCVEFEAEVRDNAPARLRVEFFPEVAATRPDVAALLATKTTAEEETKILYYVMLAAQVMEDAWVGGDLDTYWSHPLNDGWMNYFHRWASTPSFRRWWPVIRPIYSLGFRDFVRDRFNLAYHDPATPANPRGARFELLQFPLSARQNSPDLVWDYWRRLDSILPAGLPNRAILEFRLILETFPPESPAPNPPLPDQLPPNTLPVGILFYQVRGDVVEWNSDGLFVPPSLNGAGITARFLDTIVDHFKGAGKKELRVLFQSKETDEENQRKKRRRDPATRLARLHVINFYKSRGFVRPTADSLYMSRSL